MYLTPFDDDFILQWLPTGIILEFMEFLDSFIFMHVGYIHSHLFTRVIDVNMYDIKSFLVQLLRPNGHCRILNIPIFLLQIHIIKLNLSIQLSVRNGYYASFHMIVVDVIVIDVDVGWLDLHWETLVCFFIGEV